MVLANRRQSEERATISVRMKLLNFGRKRLCEGCVCEKH